MNRLEGATSPYLRQHAHNPVEWYPWGEEAFARARAEDKPLFVSIGYAACHWCHVMAHESFEDPATAEDLAASFVSVKVDREERPDVDAVYMAAVQAMTGAGGWPMTVFCTPEGRPFFAGTYFPPAERHGMPAFRQVLGAVADAWTTRRAEVERQAHALADAVARQVGVADSLAPLAEGTFPTFGALTERVVVALSPRFDPVWGGFGAAPKFPRPTLVDLCLCAHDRSGDAAALEMATTTLDAMAAGGIYDHLEGGFARYSTDREWTVPHFEKMLTDQALLVRAYLHAWQRTGRADYRQVVEETIGFVASALRAPTGGLCSSLDADADGVEGGHATWTPREVAAALEAEGMDTPDDAAALCEWYGVDEPGTLEGRSVLRRPVHAPLARPAPIEAGRRALIAARRRRPQPAVDDKVLTEWNAMCAAAIAEAAGATGSDAWATLALEVAESLFVHNTGPDGRLLRAAGGDVPAFAADLAWTVECCTRLAELTGQQHWLTRAEAVADDLLRRFSDDEHGGLFTTATDAEPLVVRPKDVIDGAVASANAIGATALARLGALGGEPRFTEAARRIVESVGGLVDHEPLAVADLLLAVGLLDDGAEIVVTAGRDDLVATVRRHWLPTAVVAWGEPGPSALWEGREPGAAYVCRHFACEAPAYDPETLDRQLLGLRGSARR